MVADVGDDAMDPIPVAIETPRGLPVAALRSSGRRVYSINPIAVARCAGLAADGSDLRGREHPGQRDRHPDGVDTHS
jgi:hypothetical protein